MKLKTVRIISNKNKPNYLSIQNKISSFMSKNNIKTVFDNENPGEEDLLITIGGDGTILKASRSIKNSETPIFGINLGKLGFLADIVPDKVEDNLIKILKNEIYLEKRIKLELEKDISALNDIVITTNSSYRVIQLLVFKDGKFLSEFVGDGIIVATPTGSTAYSLSCNGPIIYPTMDVIIVNAISPHMLTLRPFILPGNSNIEIQLCSDNGVVVIDGQLSKKLQTGDKISVRKSKKYITLLKINDTDYFSILRNKLKLGDKKARTQCETCLKKKVCLYPKMFPDKSRSYD